jgi:hypothetical protein
MRSASRCSPRRVIVDLGDAEVAHDAHYGGLCIVNKGVGQGPWHETHPRAGGSLAARACLSSTNDVAGQIAVGVALLGR